MPEPQERHWRRKHQNGQCRREIGLRPKQPAPAGRTDHQIKRRARQGQHRRVFGKQRQAGAYALHGKEEDPQGPTMYDRYSTFDRHGTFELRYARYRRTLETRGEFVLVIGPLPKDAQVMAEQELDELLRSQLLQGSVKDAVAHAVELSGRPRREIYARALELAKGSTKDADGED